MGIYERWTAKLALRRKLLAAAQARLAKLRKADTHPRQDAVDLIKTREDQVADALAVLKRHPKTDPAALALKWARSHIGVKENPPGSNSGTLITGWLKNFGSGPAPWCGAFVGSALKSVGITVSSRILYTPYIVDDAKAGRNGFEKTVAWADRRAGDVFVYDWNGDGVADHTGIYTGTVINGLAYAIEGNTAVGNDSNGGEVMQRARDPKFVLAVCRPRWP